MSASLLLEYLKESKSLMAIQEFLKAFNDIDLDLLNSLGHPISSISQDTLTVHPQADNAVLKSRNNFDIVPKYLYGLKASHKPVHFSCKEGYIKILVPIVFEGKIVGYLYTGENSAFRINKNQLQSISSFLQENLNRIIAQDFKCLKDFKGNDLTHQQRLLSRITVYLNENYHLSGLSLRTVAKENNISYYYLSHLFSRELNISFSDFLNNRRIEVARQLLKDHCVSISQVSFSCGFQDPGYFSKVFKRVEGVSPLSFRALMIGKKRATKAQFKSIREELVCA